MAINYTTRVNPKKNKDKQSIGFQIIFFALNFLAVPFSAYATFQGYRETAGGDFMAIVLAALTGVLFFGLNYLIMDRRQKGLPHLPQTLGYLLPLGISFIGNFTNFYGNQVEGDVLKTELAQYSKTFKKTYQGSIAALDKSTGLTEFKEELDKRLSQLEAQTKSGWGFNSSEEWKTIQDLCDNKLTPIYGNRTYQKAKYIAESYFSSLERSKNQDINIIKDQVNDIYSPFEMQIETVSKDKNILKKEGSNLMNNIKESNDNIGEITRGKLVDFKYETLDPHIKISKENPMVTLNHAWSSKNIGSMETITASFFSLIIDLITLVFIFLALPYKRQRKNKPTGPRSL